MAENHPTQPFEQDDYEGPDTNGPGIFDTDDDGIEDEELYEDDEDDDLLDDEDDDEDGPEEGLPAEGLDE